MSGGRTITASTIGNPVGGQDDNPWPPGHPVEGERVAVFAFQVTRVDEDAEDMRSYHIAPADLAQEGPIGSEYGAAQGISAHWVGYGTGTIIRRTDHDCEVAPDDPGLG